VDGAGLPLATASVVSVRPAPSNDDRIVWNAYDAAGRLVRQAQNTGDGSTAAVTETLYDGASRVAGVVRYANLQATNTGLIATGLVTPPPTSAQDRVTRNFYDDDGHLAGTLDGEGYLTVYNRDAAGRQVETIAYATATPAAQRATGSLAQLVPSASAS